MPVAVLFVVLVVVFLVVLVGIVALATQFSKPLRPWIINISLALFASVEGRRIVLACQKRQQPVQQHRVATNETVP